MTATIPIGPVDVVVRTAAELDPERRRLLSDIVTAVEQGTTVENGVHGPWHVPGDTGHLVLVVDELLVDVPAIQGFTAAVAAFGSPIAALRTFAAGRDHRGNPVPAAAVESAVRIGAVIRERSTGSLLGEVLAGRVVDHGDDAPGHAPAVGSFVGFGVEHVSRGDGEWLVDPDTGRITGPARGELEVVGS